MRVSVIIPAFNRADLIGATLDSLLTQNWPPNEIVVVDDGSSDGTPGVVSADGGLVRLICQVNAGAGAGAARNTGFAATTGDVIHFMEAEELSRSVGSQQRQRDLTLARAELGWELTVQLTVGIGCTIECFRNSLAADHLVAKNRKFADS